ncbi:MAG: cupin domain-containing protein [Stellaceae bacterium]
MRIHNLYADPDGETHFRDVEVECTDGRPWGNLSKCLPTAGMMFVEASGSTLADWHPAPCRQYVIILSGNSEVTASDGERRVFTAGDVVLVEDTTGKGHTTRLFVDQLHRAVFLPAE